ncbi:MAG: DUF488 domain-containing protein [bacterium]|nr:DUF488 domain-containing protein [bacterium]MDE0675601.1 DUF488 domain-containing protein [bacterium]
MEIYTIGFTKKSAEDFFASLRRNRIKRLVDVRANNTSQLAGFTKQNDLVFFLGDLLGADYFHEPLFAPTKELLKAYRNKSGLTWDEYESDFLDLLSERQVEVEISRDLFLPRTVLLCSEATSDLCHRRLVIDYLDGSWGNVQAVHL